MKNLLLENFSNEIYHFTNIVNAAGIMKQNAFFLSATKQGGTDYKLSKDGKLFYLSFTRNKNIDKSQYPVQMNAKLSNFRKFLVRFDIDGKLLNNNEKFEGNPVNYFQQKAEPLLTGNKRSTPYKKCLDFFRKQGLKTFGNNNDEFNIEDLKNLINAKSTEEDRLFSNETKFENLLFYTKSVDILFDETYIYQGDEDMSLPLRQKRYIKNIKSVVQYYSNLGEEWIEKIHFYTNKNDFNKESKSFETMGTINKFLQEKLEEFNNDSEEELSLDNSDIDFLKKSDKYILTDANVNLLAKIVYILAYNNDGIEAIKGKAVNMMNNCGLNGLKISIKNKATKIVENDIDLIECVINEFDMCKDEFETVINSEESNSFAEIKKLFDTIHTSFHPQKLIEIGLYTMYSNWLKKYKSAIDNKLNYLHNELVQNEDKLREFIMSNFRIFKDRFFEGVSINDKLVNSIFNNLIKFNGMSNLVGSLISYYKKQYYHYDEICYFKRTVIKYKNRSIKDIKNRKARYGDLAVLFGNANTANKEL